MQTIRVPSSFVLVDDDIRFTLPPEVSVDGRGYVRVAGKLLHNIIFPAPEGMEVDHINRDKMDNRRSNLRHVTHHFNSLNRAGWKTSAKGLPKGVYICGSGRFVATISWKGKRLHVGTFDTCAEAEIAYETKRQQLVNDEYKTKAP